MSDLVGNHIVGFPKRRLIKDNSQAFSQPNTSTAVRDSTGLGRSGTRSKRSKMTNLKRNGAKNFFLRGSGKDNEAYLGFEETVFEENG